MCIICNLMVGSDQSGALLADAFLHKFDQSRKAMQAAAYQMLVCSKAAQNPDVKKQYDRTHKRMVALMRQWNSLEEFREAATPLHGEARGPAIEARGTI
ncbi:hypothetical protein [Methylopila sp. M107]|uniref:hypothetical protein n=1 Tax=Methylopila sp. M107 TaxID=1101190 RepID=UPI00037D6EA0|nr:hypothetical protein [Methylopila sp. M107]